MSQIWSMEMIFTYACYWHPDAPHERALNETLLGPPEYSPLPLFEDPTVGDKFEDLFIRSWDCIVLFRSDRINDCYNLLVIDWDGDTAYRIGGRSMQESTYNGLSKTRRTIRLA